MPDRTITSTEFRAGMRNVMDEVEHRGAHVKITRFADAAMVLVPAAWHAIAVQRLRDCALCGGATMHSGQICYGCTQRLEELGWSDAT
jgi:hypothetical protein